METAIVGILGALIGIFLSNGLTMLLEARRRRERIKDVQTSLRAEMRSHMHRLAGPDLDERAEAIAARILDGDGIGKSFTPFIPREDLTLIFAAVAHEIHILPNDVIDPVVLYYVHLKAMTNFVDDMRSEQFSGLEPKRKAEMYRDYIAMVKQARDLAGAAILSIDELMASGRAQ